MTIHLFSFVHRNRRNILVASVIVLAASALYLPYLSSELVFDDRSFFYSGNVFSYYATRPFDLSPRTFPYFTFAFIHALTQSFEVQRVANLLIHTGNAWLLFRVSQQLLITIDSSPNQTDSPIRVLDKKEMLICGLLALAFVLHPVAVYGTAYLVQRTILFATSFSLLSLLFFLRSLATNTWQPVILAALFASTSMLSKEHAVALPFAVCALLAATNLRHSTAARAKTLTFFLLCIPAIFLVIFASKQTTANAYEIHASFYLSATDSGRMLWLRSALGQCSSFFDYLRLWLIPDTSLMSVDLRRHFPATWYESQALVAGVCFILGGIIGIWLLIRSLRYRLAGFGLTYALILFSVELTTVRVQEPFVLYRSYLWAPGFLLMGAALLQNLPKRLLITLAIVVLPMLAYMSANRLDSLSSGRNAWEDAAQKLSSEDLPGAFRIYYNRGIHYISANRYDLAVDDMERCQRLSPNFPGCYMGQASVLERRHELEPALLAVEKALVLDMKNAAAWEKKGRLHDTLGNHQASTAAYAEADRLGGSLTTLFRKKVALPQTMSSGTNRK